MADEDSNGTNQRLRYSQVIEASLLSMGSGGAAGAQAEEELDYAAQVMGRAVASLKAYERKVDFHHLQEHEKMKAMLTLNTVYALQSKVLSAQAAREREEQQQRDGGGAVVPFSSSSSPNQRVGGGGPGALAENNFNPFFPNRSYAGAGVGEGNSMAAMDTSRVSASSSMHGRQ